MTKCSFVFILIHLNKQEVQQKLSLHLNFYYRQRDGNHLWKCYYNDLDGCKNFKTQIMNVKES